MIIDFHTHVLSPVDQDKYTTSKFHQTVLASRDFGRRHPATIENVLEAAKIGGVDISIISNPLHDPENGCGFNWSDTVVTGVKSGYRMSRVPYSKEWCWIKL